jgi:hypothetical protein
MNKIIRDAAKKWTADFEAIGKLGDKLEKI